MRSPTPRCSLAATLLSASAVLVGCKKQEEPTCAPDSVDWRMQLAIQSSKNINPTDDGESLPTVIRVFQLRGELAIDNIEFDRLWEAEEPAALGESFLSMEEITMYPDKTEVREIPVEDEATHVLAAGLFRKPASTSWFTSYEIPVSHPEIVCNKAPVDKVYPNPCFYLFLDRSVLDGGANPPSGYELSPNLSCAPLGVTLTPTEDDKARRKRKRKERRDERRRRRQQIEDTPDELERQLDGQKPDVPGSDKVPDAELPDTRLPDSIDPDIPEVPDAPEAPSLPN